MCGTPRYGADGPSWTGQATGLGPPGTWRLGRPSRRCGRVVLLPGSRVRTLLLDLARHGPLLLLSFPARAAPSLLPVGALGAHVTSAAKYHPCGMAAATTVRRGQRPRSQSCPINRRRWVRMQASSLTPEMTSIMTHPLCSFGACVLSFVRQAQRRTH